MFRIYLLYNFWLFVVKMTNVRSCMISDCTEYQQSALCLYVWEFHYVTCHACACMSWITRANASVVFCPQLFDSLFVKFQPLCCCILRKSINLAICQFFPNRTQWISLAHLRDDCKQVYADCWYCCRNILHVKHVLFSALSSDVFHFPLTCLLFLHLSHSIINILYFASVILTARCTLQWPESSDAVRCQLGIVYDGGNLLGWDESRSRRRSRKAS